MSAGEWAAVISALVAVVIALATAAGIFFTLKGAVENLKEDLAEIKTELKQMVQLTIAQNLMAERITATQQTQVNQGKRLDDLTRRVNTYLDMKLIAKLEDLDPS